MKVPDENRAVVESVCPVGFGKSDEAQALLAADGTVYTCAECGASVVVARSPGGAPLAPPGWWSDDWTAVPPVVRCCSGTPSQPSAQGPYR